LIESAVDCDELIESAGDYDQLTESAVDCDGLIESAVDCDELIESAVDCDVLLTQFAVIVCVQRSMCVYSHVVARSDLCKNMVLQGCGRL